MQTRKQRVKELQEFIQENSNGEDYFDLLYGKLLIEIKLENAFDSNRKTNSYLNNLIQTNEKQAEIYKKVKAKGKKKDSGSAFIDFLNHFRQDLNESEQ
jgi:hypothetical protein